MLLHSSNSYTPLVKFSLQVNTIALDNSPLDFILDTSPLGLENSAFNLDFDSSNPITHLEMANLERPIRDLFAPYQPDYLII